MRRGYLFVSILLVLLFLAKPAFSDPGNRDTCRVEQKLTVGASQKVTVQVYVYNDEQLGAFQIPLTFYNPDNHDVVCDSVHWAQRFWDSYTSTSGLDIDATNHRLRIWAIWMSGFFSTGSGLLATVHFTTGPSWNPNIGIIVDSTFILPSSKLEFIDDEATIITPVYVPGCLGSALRVNKPNGGEVWYVGSNYDITWSSVGFAGNVKLDYSTNSGSTWSTIVGSTTNDGSDPWPIPNTPSPNCRVKVSDASDGSPWDRSNANFSIPDFTIDATPELRKVDVGGGTTYDVDLGYVYGFAHPITLSVLGLPTGASGAFSPNPVTPPSEASVMTVNTTGSTPGGTYTLTIQGQGSQIHTTQVKLVVNVAPSAFALLSPDSGSTVSTLTPTVSWQAATDPDPLDTVKYTLYYTRKSDFSQYDSIAGLATTSRVLPTLNDDTLYFWKVKAVDKWGEATWSNSTWNFHVYYPQQPLTFSLIYPANQDTIWELSDTLRWHSTADPDPGDYVVYDLYYDTHSGFASPTVIPDLTDTSYYFTGKDDSTYYWKVLAKDTNTSGRWSTLTFRFRVYMPQSPNPFSLASPADDDTVHLHPGLAWHKGTDPDPQDQLTYTLYWSLDSLFGTSSEATTSDTAYTLPELLNDTLYYWKVKAKDKYGLFTWSSEPYWGFRSLNVAPATFSLVSPTDHSTVPVLTPTLKWRKAFDPDPFDLISYIVYYSLDNAFAVYESVVTTDTTRILPTLYDDSTYYWKVKAFDHYGGQRWSSETDWSFDVYYPQPPLVFTLLSPPHQATLADSIFDFIWQSTTDPDPGDVLVYDLWYDVNSGFTNPTKFLGLTDTVQNVTVRDDKTYYWKVLAKDTNTSGRWSTNIFSVSIYVPQPPKGFSLLLPENQDTITVLEPTLKWHRAVDPDPGDVVTYDLYYDTLSNFSTAVVAGGLSDTSYTTPELEVGTSYWWKVKAEDTNTAGIWSTEIFEFYIPSCILGDINGDGKSDIVDIVYLVNYVLRSGNPPQPILGCGDMQCDGKVDIVDVVYLINYTLRDGPPPLPCY